MKFPRIMGACVSGGGSRDRRGYTSTGDARLPAASFPLSTKVPSLSYCPLPCLRSSRSSSISPSSSSATATRYVTPFRRLADSGLIQDCGSSLPGVPSLRRKVSCDGEALFCNSLMFCPEFVQISKAVAIGFAVMGFIGYFVKLIHIPMYVPSVHSRILSLTLFSATTS